MDALGIIGIILAVAVALAIVIPMAMMSSQERREAKTKAKFRILESGNSVYEVQKWEIDRWEHVCHVMNLNAAENWVKEIAKPQEDNRVVSEWNASGEKM